MSNGTTTPEERRCRLLACAGCRLVWGRLPRVCQQAVEAAEAFVDGRITDEARAAVYQRTFEHENSACLIRTHWRRMTGTQIPDDDPNTLITRTIRFLVAPTCSMLNVNAVLYDLMPWCGECAENRELQAKQQLVFSDIMSIPFSASYFDAAWRTPNVGTLSAEIYENQKFSRMPELAQALADAGCTERVILDHCRSDRQHVRGCWALDWVAGLL